MKLLDGLTDAQQMAKLHPKTFWAPSAEDLSEIAPGDLVKICRNEERFWVIVTKVTAATIAGEVNNHLTNNPDLPAGAPVRFKRCNVFIIERPSDEDDNQAAYDRAADIAHDMIADLPEKVLAADADPIDADYALWTTFTRILMENGWTACDLAENAHEIAADTVVTECTGEAEDATVH